MKKNCKIVEDLLPLYLDKVASPESCRFIEEHLKDCPNCLKYLDKLNYTLKNNKLDALSSLKKFLKKINFKIIKNSLIITSIILLIFIPILYFISNYEFTENYNKDINIAIRGNEKRWNFQFYSPLAGNGYATSWVVMENGKPVTLVFVTWKYTLKDYLSSKKNFHVSNVPDLDYQSLDLNNEIRVYYTKENLNKIKGALSEDLPKYIKKSTLIFKNNKTTTNLNCTLNNTQETYTFTYYDYNGQLLEASGNNAILKHLLNPNYYYESMDFQDITLISENAHEIMNLIKNHYTKNKGTCEMN